MGPGRSDSTIEKVESQIDYLLVSKSLAGRIKTFCVDDRTKHWCDPGTVRSSYHSAIVATLQWNDMWLGSGAEPAPVGEPLKGAKLKLGPNYTALTPDRAKFHNLLFHRWSKLEACWKGKKPLATKRDTLVNDYKAALLKVATSVLGVARPRSEQEGTGAALALDDEWDDMVALVQATHWAPQLWAS